MAEEVRPHTAIIIIIEPERRAATPRLPNRLPRRGSRLGHADSSGGGRGNGGNVLFDVASSVFRKQKGRIIFAFGSFWTRFPARRSR